jgi:hypothetical protein
VGFAAGQLIAVLLSVAAPQPLHATLVDGRIIQGTWAAADEKSILLQVEGQDQRLDLPDLMDLRWAVTTSRPTSSSPDGVHVYLSDGSRFDARILGGDQKTVRLETSLSPQLDLPLSNIAGIRFGASGTDETSEAFDSALATPDSTEDTVLPLRDGKVTPVRGVLESITPAGIRFRWRDRPMQVPRENLLGIVLATGGRPHRAAPALLLLRDGAAWAGQIVSGNATALHILLGAGAGLDVPLDRLAEIRFQSDRIAYLSAIDPATYDFQPFLTTRWAYRRDHAVTGRPLSLGGQAYEHGLGMHSQSTLTYEIGKRFAQLAATIGIDDEVRPLGSVVFRVLADGKEVFNSGNVTGHDAPRDILVPIQGAATVQLVVDFGENLDIGDHADWANIRLIK